MITALLVIAQFQAFTLVSADSTGPGQMLRVTAPGTDTLQVYIEHVTPHEGPDRKVAEGADRVAWCYPQKYRDDRHLMDYAEGRIIMLRRDGMVAFMTELEARQRGAIER